MWWRLPERWSTVPLSLGLAPAARLACDPAWRTRTLTVQCSRLTAHLLGIHPYRPYRIHSFILTSHTDAAAQPAPAGNQPRLPLLTPRRTLYSTPLHSTPFHCTSTPCLPACLPACPPSGYLAALSLFHGSVYLPTCLCAQLPLACSHPRLRPPANSSKAASNSLHIDNSTSPSCDICSA